MHVSELRVRDAFTVTPAQHRDDRGVFLELFRADVLAGAIGHPPCVAQVNGSVSARGVLRGIHYAEVPPGQAKYVSCQHGAVLDVVVDLRVGSPTFGAWEMVRLDDADRRAVYVAEGLGHALLALTDGATVSYLCSTPYAPGREHAVSALDPDVGIAWPADITRVQSDRDASAPRLAEARDRGMLPAYDACRRLYEALRAAGTVER